jgi:hypothetical protein
MTRLLTFCTALTLIASPALALQAPAAWPPASRADLAKTVILVHDLSGPATLVRGGKTYSLVAFTSTERANRNLKPIRLAVLDGDQFWLGAETFATVSFVKGSGVSSSQASLLASQRIGRDFREKGATYLKSYSTLPANVHEQISLLVRLGQNSKPLDSLHEPTVLLPIPGDILPAKSIPFRLWPGEGTKWSELTVVYRLSDRDVPFWESKTISGVGVASISRAAIVTKLNEIFAPRTYPSDRAIPMSLIAREADSSSTRHEVGISIAAEDQARIIEANTEALRKALASEPSIERELLLAELCAYLRLSRSLVLQALSSRLKDPAVESIFLEICEQVQMSGELFR